MRLVVISPDSDRADELDVVRRMLAAGLTRYHLRKPNWSAEKLRAWLGSLSSAERSKVVLHSHPELVREMGLLGAHFPEGSGYGSASAEATNFTSRACHDISTTRALLGEVDAVLVSPLFPSISKPGHGVDNALSHAELRSLLATRTNAQRGTEVVGLGGIDASNIARCRELGLDGVAVLGAIWHAADPLEAVEQLKLRTSRVRQTDDTAIMCITQDRLPWSHADQARRLCAGGARWIQLRMKHAEPAAWLAMAQEFCAICREHGAVSIINDSVEIALAARADGVHLGKLDQEWASARRQLRPGMILGGTVNNVDDAHRAAASGVLDYVGVGPWRFTANKKNLSPILAQEGVARVLQHLGGLPAWVIGGIEADDLAAVRATGAAGAAVSSALYRDGAIEKNVRQLRGAWKAVASTRQLITTL